MIKSRAFTVKCPGCSFQHAVRRTMRRRNHPHAQISR